MAKGFEPDAGETLLEEWVAGIPGKSGRKVHWGGTLHLTDRRVAWRVVRLTGRKGVFRLTPDGLVMGAVAGVVNTAVRSALGDRSGIDLALTDVTAVAPDGDKGSVLRVEAAGGSLRVLVTASKWGYNASADAAVRDAAVARIREACGLG